MNHHNKKILEALFSHPMSANIDFKDVQHVLVELGAQVEEKSDSKIAISLAGRSMILHRPHHHTIPKDEVASLRGFLTECGVDPTHIKN